MFKIIIPLNQAKSNYLSTKKGGERMETLYSCEEVAKRYRVKVFTVWEWIRKKKLPAMKLGKSYLITESALKAFEKAMNV